MRTRSGSKAPSPGQRAFWTVLIHTLAGPFFAALAVAGARLLLPPLKLAALVPPGAPDAASLALATFVWVPIPAALAGLLLAPAVLRNATYSAFAAALAGILAFAVSATLLAPVDLGALRVAAAALAGLVALAVRYVLRVARMLD